MTPPVRTLPAAEAHRLVLQVQKGNLDDAFQELAKTPWEQVHADPIRNGLRDAVALQLAARTAADYEEVVPKLVHAFDLVPVACERIALDIENRMHLVVGRELDGEDLTEHWRFICGLEIEQDIEDPMALALRGCWKEPEPHLASHCSGCAPHAADYPETDEPADTYRGARKLSDELDALMRQRTLEFVHQRLAELVHETPEEAYNEVGLMYEDAIAHELVERAKAGGEELVRRVTRRYYVHAQTELAECGYDGPLSELITEQDWLRAAENALEDAGEEEGDAISITYLYLELRGVLGSRIRTMRAKAA